MRKIEKRIDIAVVGDRESGKTFVIEAMINILSNLQWNIYPPIASDVFELNRTSNGLNDLALFEPLHDSFKKATNIYSPDYITDLINSNIDNTSNIKTQKGGALYSAVLNKAGKKYAFISFFNISGEAFSNFFSPLPNMVGEGAASAINVMKNMEAPKKLFWAQNSNDSWDDFLTEAKRFYSDRGIAFDRTVELYFEYDLKPNYQAILYACNATDIIFCSEGKNKKNGFSANNFTSLNTFFEGKPKNYYEVLTKVDRYLQKKVLLGDIDHFEEYYATLLRLLLDNNYDSAFFTTDDALLTELKSQRGLFNSFLDDGYERAKHKKIKQYAVACNLHYGNRKESEFILFVDPVTKKDQWDTAKNMLRRSIGIRELLSTIFYNNNNVDEMGNLLIYNEYLAGFYYA